MKTLVKILFGACFAAIMTGAQAATIPYISLSPISNSAPLGGQVAFNILADFGSTSTSGGAMDFSWNSAVMTYSNFVFGAGLAVPIRDSFFDVNDLQNPGLLSIGFGNFTGMTLTGPVTIGTLTFNVVGTTGSSTPIGLSDSALHAGFFDTATFSHINVSYTGATASVSAVPLPGALWLLFSGLSPLGLVLRRKAS